MYDPLDYNALTISPCMQSVRDNVLSVPKFTANLLLLKKTANLSADAVHICGKFWDTIIVNMRVKTDPGFDTQLSINTFTCNNIVIEWPIFVIVCGTTIPSHLCSLNQ